MAREKPTKNIDDEKLSLFSIIRRSIAFVVGLLFTLLVSWVFTLVIESIGIFFFWSDQGSLRSATILTTELGYLNGDNYVGSVSTSSEDEVIRTTQTLYDKLIVGSGADALFSTADEWGKALKNVTLIFLVRIAILKSILILYGFATFWAIHEGLVIRAHRRWTGAIERSYVFHHIKLFLSIIILLPVPIYLAMPFALHPMAVNAPFILIYMMLIVCAVGFFKKFL